MRIAIAVLFGLAAIMPMTATSADAKGKGKSKMCTGMSLIENKKVSFKCKASEKCCFDAVTAKGTCVASNAVCL